MTTNKEKAVTAGTVHGKIIKYSICIIADNEENVKMKIKICLCRKCGARRFTSLSNYAAAREVTLKSIARGRNDD